MENEKAMSVIDAIEAHVAPLRIALAALAAKCTDKTGLLADFDLGCEWLRSQDQASSRPDAYLTLLESQIRQTRTCMQRE